MSLKSKYSHEELEKTSMLELANDILHDEKKAMDFNALFDKVAEMKGFTDDQKHELIAQFYTDLTVDGRFLTIGSGVWGLKRWYPVEQMDEEVAAVPKKKKKGKKKKKDEEEEEEVHEESKEESEPKPVEDSIEILTENVEPEESLEEFDSEDDDFDDDLDDDEFNEDEEEDDHTEEDDKDKKDK